MMYYWNNFGTWGWMEGIFMMVFWFIIIFGFIYFVIWMVRGNGSASCCGEHDHGGFKHQDYEEKSCALTILKERYAKGEIDKKEFEEKKKDLEE